MNIPYTCDQPPFDPNERAERAWLIPLKDGGAFVRVSQNGYVYRTPTFTTVDEAEAHMKSIPVFDESGFTQP